MNQNIFKYTLLYFFAVAVMLSGCDKKKLDLLPRGPGEASYFSSETEYNKAVFGIYAKMSDFYWFNGNSPHVGLFFLPGDDLTTNGSNEESEVFRKKIATKRWRARTLEPRQKTKAFFPAR